MTDKGYFLRLAVSAVSSLLCLALFMVLTNPYGVYSPSLLPTVVVNSKQKKERIVQAHWKNGTIRQFDGIILGTSPMLSFDREMLQEATA